MNERITRLIAEQLSAEELDAERLTPLVYEELHRLAERYMAREPTPHTLQPTALVHEAFVALSSGAPLSFRGQAHFKATAARCMQNLLVDRARRRRRHEAEEGPPTLTLTGGGDLEARGLDVLELEEALERLAERSPVGHAIARLRFYGDLTRQEVAEALGISESTAHREWIASRAFLLRELS